MQASLALLRAEGQTLFLKPCCLYPYLACKETSGQRMGLHSTIHSNITALKITCENTVCASYLPHTTVLTSHNSIYSTHLPPTLISAETLLAWLDHSWAVGWFHKARHKSWFPVKTLILPYIDFQQTKKRWCPTRKTVFVLNSPLLLCHVVKLVCFWWEQLFRFPGKWVLWVSVSL